MKIGVLVPSIYTEKIFFPNLIFAPYNLGVELANGLAARGHEVYFYGVSSTKTNAKLIAGDASVLEKALKKRGITGPTFQQNFPENFRIIQDYFELSLVEKAYLDLEAGKIDIVHHFHDFLSLFIHSIARKKRSLITLHDPLPVYKYHRNFWLFSAHKNANYVSISRTQRQPMPNLNYVGTAYNGIDLKKYEFNAKPHGYCAFLGRIIKIKGVHLAIEAAIKAKMPLRIAGNTYGRRKSKYFAKMVEPELDKNSIRRVGFVAGEKKVEFLKNARALLFPILWEEPFGMVVIEAMACGTPVIAFNRGSVREIIKDGETGFVVNDIPEMVQAIKKIGEIKRENCRKRVEQMFSIEKMVEKYEIIYHRVMERSKK